MRAEADTWMINNVESHALSLFRKARKQRGRGGVHSRAYQ